MYPQFIKLILPLPSFFDTALPTNEEPNVFRVTVQPQEITCQICKGATVCHDRFLRSFRHGYAWYIGVLWVDFVIPNLW